MKKIILIVLPLLLISGGVVACAMLGVINIPGLSPKKKAKTLVAAAGLYTEKKEPRKINKPPKPVATVKPKDPEPDLDLGAKKLAKYWNELPAKTLKEIAAKWKDEDLVRVLVKMDVGKATEVLGSLDAARASKLSELIQSQASLVVSQ